MRDIVYVGYRAALCCHPARACATRIDLPPYSSQPDTFTGLSRLR